MSSIRRHFPFSALRRHRHPPDRDRAEVLPALLPLPGPEVGWVVPAPAPAMREQVAVLEAEKALAALHGLDRDGAYADDLRTELAAAKAAYVGTAVVELAVLRAELGGRLQG